MWHLIYETSDLCDIWSVSTDFWDLKSDLQDFLYHSRLLSLSACSFSSSLNPEHLTKCWFRVRLLKWQQRCQMCKLANIRERLPIYHDWLIGVTCLSYLQSTSWQELNNIVPFRKQCKPPSLHIYLIQVSQMLARYKLGYEWGVGAAISEIAIESLQPVYRATSGPSPPRHQESLHPVSEVLQKLNIFPTPAPTLKLQQVRVGRDWFCPS